MSSTITTTASPQVATFPISTKALDDELGTASRISRTSTSGTGAGSGIRRTTSKGIENFEIEEPPLGRDAGASPHPSGTQTMTEGMKKKENIYFLASCMALFLAGWNDASAGPLLPRMQDAYHVGFAVVSLIFILNCVGFISAAVMNVWLTDKFGFGIVITFGSVCQLVAYAIQSPQPPFPLMVISYAINGFGMALQDAQANGLVAGLPTNPSGKMNLVHGIYGLGALVSPLVATQFSQQKRWSFHFLTSLGVALINTAGLLYAFRLRTQDDLLADIGVVHSDDFSPTEDSPDGVSPAPNRSKYNEIMRLKVVHLMALFIFVYVGVEVTIGGWMVTFVLEKRGGGASAGYISSGFFGGLTVGRIALIWFNKLIGERNVIWLYGVLAIALEFTIWFVPSLIENAVAVSIVGVVLGPFYPIVMNMASALIPRKLLTGSIGWIASIGQTGSAAFPFILAVMAQRHGVQVLQPLLVAMIGFLLFIWLWVPSPKRRVD